MLQPLLRQDSPIPTEHLVQVLYGYRADGGPDNAEHAVRNQMCKIRARLQKLGIEIETVGYGRASAGYRVSAAHREALGALLGLKSVI
jgi:hypothetical protein